MNEKEIGKKNIEEAEKEFAKQWNELPKIGRILGAVDKSVWKEWFIIGFTQGRRREIKDSKKFLKELRNS